MKPRLKPLGNHVVIRPVEPAEVTVGGVIIPKVAHDGPVEGIVVALGAGATDKRGQSLACLVKPGERVFVSARGGTEILFGDETLRIFTSAEILAIVTYPRDEV